MCSSHYSLYSKSFSWLVPCPLTHVPVSCPRPMFLGCCLISSVSVSCFLAAVPLSHYCYSLFPAPCPLSSCSSVLCILSLVCYPLSSVFYLQFCTLSHGLHPCTISPVSRPMFPCPMSSVVCCMLSDLSCKSKHFNYSHDPFI